MHIKPIMRVDMLTGPIATLPTEACYECVLCVGPVATLPTEASYKVYYSGYPTDILLAIRSHFLFPFVFRTRYYESYRTAATQ